MQFRFYIFLCSDIFLGSMKTYWLESKDSRMRIPKVNDSPVQALERNRESKDLLLQEAGRPIIYSPITFQDVARRSIASSPIKANTRGKIHIKNKYTVCLF